MNVTYNELSDLISNSQLIPGQNYRITDYVTTTSQEYSISECNRFDIIVTAITNNVISDDAKAINCEGDTYFNTQNLSSWVIKYYFYNDISKFKWADSEGTGVIYYMKDEYGNEAPYDFKNIRFQNANNSSNLNYYYTFSEVIDDVIYDKSLNTRGVSCYNNIIRTYHVNQVQTLNRIIFVNKGSGYSCYGNQFGINCYNNTFTSNCTNNKLGNHCKANIFGDNFQTNKLNNNCSNNVFNNYCYYNSFGNNCCDNNFGNYCDYNSFGNNCYENALGGYCNSNFFGNDCYNNTLGSYNYNNSFSNYCYYNTLGTSCYSNSFGNSCNYNKFGNNCSYSTLENDCRYITFGSSLSSVSHYYAHNSFGSGVQYFVLKSNDTASSGTQVQHVRVANGIKGSSSSPVSVTVSRTLSYETKIAYNSSGTLKKFCSGD